MLDELFLKILQLSKEDKLKILRALESDLNYIEEGARFSRISMSAENETELLQRYDDVIKEKMCLIEFDDHIAHLQNISNG